MTRCGCSRPLSKLMSPGRGCSASQEADGATSARMLVEVTGQQLEGLEERKTQKGAGL